MRAAILLLLLGLALLSAITGNLAVALALAVAKSLLVGVEYMELRHAHRAHLAGFVLFVVAVAVGLLITARPSPPPSRYGDGGGSSTTTLAAPRYGDQKSGLSSSTVRARES